MASRLNNFSSEKEKMRKDKAKFEVQTVDNLMDNIMM